MIEKVLKFPAQNTSRSERKPLTVNPQTHMFSQWDDSRAHFVFLDLSDLDQDKLSNIITRNGVSSIFDLRSKPVFEKPKFDHREFLKYINRHDIPYYDAAYFSHVRDTTSGMWDSEGIKNALNKGLVAGLVLILLNDRLLEGIDKELVRRTMRVVSHDAIEMTPSSVLT